MARQETNCTVFPMAESMTGFHHSVKETFVLLSLAAGLKVLEENGRNGIITFLDDFEAGLDENRIRKVFEMFSSSSQIFVTGVKNHYFSDLHSIRIQVKNDEHSQ